MSKLQAKKNRGQYKGEPLYPHKHKDGTFVASSSRYEVDYIPVETEDELASLVEAGFGARMSNPEIKQAPSFISSEKITLIAEKIKNDVSVISELPRLVNEADLDGDSRSKTRKEQSFLRAHLTKGNLVSECTICGNLFPIEMLAAAHIKRRSECTKSEKLDFDNVATLMCKVGCDDLFEKGYIFVREGKIIQNHKRRSTDYLNEIISKLQGKSVKNWPGSSQYYSWHESKYNK
ncbi:hypothetical protein [Cycloclasticus sp.]|jgi:hypothetical protein|uniref:hypothetical protein n=1 Tax=Cycloclasticus sp. TaxID=2024830 RepID=UPI000C0D1D9F|nr:hypothetical protein [Cycloclasticus sp.]PHR48398.1 MAG: hypothetical protein COA48_08840 [Cycloclasticus sp.]